MSNLLGLCWQTRLSWSLGNRDITDTAGERVFWGGWCFCVFVSLSPLSPHPFIFFFLLLPSSVFPASFSFSPSKLQLWLRIADLALHKIKLSKAVVRAPSQYERKREQSVSACEKWGDPSLEALPSFHEWCSELMSVFISYQWQRPIQDSSTCTSSTHCYCLRSHHAIALPSGENPSNSACLMPFICFPSFQTRAKQER